jgi:hypothetical protein
MANQNFTAIANAIRAKDGTTAPIIGNDFAARVLAIPGGGGTLMQLDSAVMDMSTRIVTLTGSNLQDPDDHLFAAVDNEYVFPVTLTDATAGTFYIPPNVAARSTVQLFNDSAVSNQALISEVGFSHTLSFEIEMPANTAFAVPIYNASATAH